MHKCKSWSRYKGLKDPTCNGGDPCVYCRGYRILKQQEEVATYALNTAMDDLSLIQEDLKRFKAREWNGRYDRYGYNEDTPPKR